jgi:hypothetical protein
MRKLYLALIPVLLLATSCTKSTSTDNNAAKQRADEFAASIKGHKYKLVSFYADKPIDYITNDNVVKSETDLWIYVREYLKDDVYLFNADGTFTIFQNAVKQPGNESASFNMSYKSSVDGKDVGFDYISPDYATLHYKLDQFDNANFIIYVDGPSGSKLFSK